MGVRHHWFDTFETSSPGTVKGVHSTNQARSDETVRRQ